MNDFEKKLRSFELRRPDPAWRQEILTHSSSSTSNRTLWAYLWPSPLAWAALFFIWTALGVASRIDRPAGVAGSPNMARASSSQKTPASVPPPLLAFQTSRQFEELYSLSKPTAQ